MADDPKMIEEVTVAVEALENANANYKLFANTLCEMIRIRYTKEYRLYGLVVAIVRNKGWSSAVCKALIMNVLAEAPIEWRTALYLMIDTRKVVETR